MGSCQACGRPLAPAQLPQRRQRGARPCSVASQRPGAANRRLQLCAAVQAVPFGAAPPLAPPLQLPLPASQQAADLLAGAGRLVQSSSEQLQSAVGGVQLPSVSGLELPTLPADVDAQQAASMAAQAAGTAAEGLVQAAQTAVAPLDVFEGAWLLNMLFWGTLLLMAYSLIALAPRQ